MAMIFLLGGVAENQLRLIPILAANLGGLVQLLTIQISVFWAMAFAAAGALLVLFASRMPRGRRAAGSRSSRLADRVGKQERIGWNREV